MEIWIRWGHLYNAGGEPDLRIRNHDLWPPSGKRWEDRTAIRESECQSFLDSSNSKGLSSLFSVSPGAFVFALGSWEKQFDSVFEAIPESPSLSYALQNEMPEAALAEVSDVLCLISEAHANVERESDVAKFDRTNITRLKKKLGTMLSYHLTELHVSDLWHPNEYPFIVSDCRDFENTLMRMWLTELAWSADCRQGSQSPSPDENSQPGGLDKDPRRTGNVPYWDDAKSTLWLRGRDRSYASQLKEETRAIFHSLQETGWNNPAPCSINRTEPRAAHPEATSGDTGNGRSTAGCGGRCGKPSGYSQGHRRVAAGLTNADDTSR